LPRKQKPFTMSDIAIRVKKIIVDKLGVDEAEVTNEASFTSLFRRARKIILYYFIS